MRLLPAVLLAFAMSWAASAQTYTISTFAGGALPVNIPGTSASLYGPSGVAVDEAGNVFFTDYDDVLRLDAATGILTLVAGNGTPGFSANGTAAAGAQLNQPIGVAVDSAGNVYVAESKAHRVIMVANGVITIVAGTGTSSFDGDGGPATAANLSTPVGVALDAAGNLYIADSGSNRIRKVSNGVITTVAGNGTFGFSGDNGPATSAQLNVPMGIAVDSSGNLYISDFSNARIRKVANGVISTVAGNGTFGGSGDNGPATTAQLNYPEGMAVDSQGNLFIADRNNDRIRKVANGIITTVAGSSSEGFGGDGGSAAGASLFFPQGVAVDPSGNLFIADSINDRIRKVSSGVITTVAGNGTQGFIGDNGPAGKAQVDVPQGIAVDSVGNLYIADSRNHRIRKVTHGVISTVAGNGTGGFSGDGGPATSAQLDYPQGVAVDSVGDLYLADVGNARIRKVTNGVISTIAGNGTIGFSGDNGAAINAQLAEPQDIAVDAVGSLYIADTGNYRIRKVSNGVITTFAGNGAVQGLSGDGGPATGAQLSPSNVAVDSSGNLYITDSGRIRRVANGVITTVGGGGSNGLGDNGPAIGAQLGASGIAVDSAGNLFVADNFDERIRKISNGLINTVAGSGPLGFSGDNGPAINAQLYLGYPSGVAVDSTGNVYFADAGNNRIRLLTPNASSCTYSVAPASLPVPASGGELTVNIQTTAFCAWTISSLPSWITTAALSGSGNATITLVVAPNNSSASLTATISVAGISVTITQPPSAPGPSITPGGIGPVYSSSNTIEPGEWASIYGTNLASGRVTWNSDFPISLGGSSVTIDGKPAYLAFVSPEQINFQVPDDSFTGTVTVVVTTAAGSSTSTVTLGQFGPCFALLDGKHVAGIIIRTDGSGAYNGGAYDIIGPTGTSLGFKTVAAKAGDIVELFGTGFGPTNPAVPSGKPFSGAAPAVNSIQVLINTVNVMQSFGGLSGPGLYQFNFTVPAGLGTGDIPLSAMVGGFTTPTGVVISLR